MTSISLHRPIDEGPCGDEENPDVPPEGLECAAGADVDELLCHPTCEVDEDCPWAGALSCQDGLCLDDCPDCDVLERC